MLQKATRSFSAPPCTCGLQPFHVTHFGRNLHSYECPPCGISTSKFGSDALALMKWRQLVEQKDETPALRAVKNAA